MRLINKLSSIKLTFTVTIRTVASLLNAISPSSVSQFKDAGLEYVSLSLEAVLENS